MRVHRLGRPMLVVLNEPLRMRAGIGKRDMLDEWGIVDDLSDAVFDAAILSKA